MSIQWDDNQQQFHDTVFSREDGTPIVRLDDDDIEQLEANGWTVDAYHEVFIQCFAMHSDDPNNALLPEERGELREEFFALIEAIGYDMEDFDWDKWREWMGYE